MEHTLSNGNVKHVFVCGLHRSGTTPLAHDIGRFKDCTAFADTGVIMDEGQFLQDVYPLDTGLTGPGLFGFVRKAHLTETSTLLTPQNVSRLRKSWEPYWDSKKRIRIEKTPRNLVMTRFLQAAFENAYFVVIKRHPVPVSLATQKWTGLYLHNLFEHWLQCHRIFNNDKKHLKRAYELRYEDYVKYPVKYLKEIAAFIGTESTASGNHEGGGNYNDKYLTRWAEMVRGSRRRAYYRGVALLFERKFAAHGYSVVRPLEEMGISIGKDTPVRHASTVLTCRALDTYSYSQRKWGWPGPETKRLIRTPCTAYRRAISGRVSGTPVD